MIPYDRMSWWSTCFALRGSVLPHILARVGLLTGLALALYLIDEQVLRPMDRPLPKLDSLGHSVLGVALSMLIVFRTNSSNNRYWEARSHWGMIVNTSRNLVRLGAVQAGPADELARLVTAYVLLLKTSLRDTARSGQCSQSGSRTGVGSFGERCQPAAGAGAQMSAWVADRQREGRLDAMMASRMEGLIGVLIDNQGGCEKIHRTPLPFVYASLIKQVLFIYLATLPLVLVPVMHFMAPLVVMGVSLGMLGIEEAGVEIEDPFGLDDNHLPLEDICANIARDVQDLTGPTSSVG